MPDLGSEEQTKAQLAVHCWLHQWKCHISKKQVSGGLRKVDSFRSSFLPAPHLPKQGIWPTCPSIPTLGEVMDSKGMLRPSTAPANSRKRDRSQLCGWLKPNRPCWDVGFLGWSITWPAALGQGWCPQLPLAPLPPP